MQEDLEVQANNMVAITLFLTTLSISLVLHFIYITIKNEPKSNKYSSDKEHDTQLHEMYFGSKNNNIK